MYQFNQLSRGSDLESVYLWLSNNLTACGRQKPQLHVGNLMFDQYICCQSPDTYSHFYYAISENEQLIGYLYLEDENFAVYLAHHLEDRRRSVISAVESTFYSSSDQVVTIENLGEPKRVESIENQGYQKGTYYRYSGVCDLGKADWSLPILNKGFKIGKPKAAHGAAIAELIGFAIGDTVSLNTYEHFVSSDVYRRHAEPWIILNEVDTPVAYAVFWVDENSQTAVLEPVACAVNYRGQGLTKALLLQGMQELAERGIQFAYVGTSGTNQASQALYKSVGFQNYGWEYEFVKTL